MSRNALGVLILGLIAGVVLSWAILGDGPPQSSAPRGDPAARDGGATAPDAGESAGLKSAAIEARMADLEARLRSLAAPERGAKGGAPEARPGETQAEAGSAAERAKRLREIWQSRLDVARADLLELRSRSPGDASPVWGFRMESLQRAQDALDATRDLAALEALAAQGDYPTYFRMP